MKNALFAGIAAVALLVAPALTPAHAMTQIPAAARNDQSILASSSGPQGLTIAFTDAKMSRETASANGKMSRETASANGKMSRELASANGKMSRELASANGKMSRELASADGAASWKQSA